VALLVLHASALQVSLLAALSGIGAAVVSLPLGSWIEYRRKRPVMVAADSVRFFALLSVPAAAAAHALTYAQLCAVGVISTMGAIAFGAASGAHLKALVSPGKRLIAINRFETTNWVSATAGPPIGGALISAFGATVTMAVDGTSFLLSALGVRRIRQPEPRPPVSSQKGADLRAGWRYLFEHRDLRALFLNAMLFGGAVMMTSPLIATLMLDRLGLSARDYGLALGLPCLGGVAGSRLAPSLTRRFGQRRVLLTTGALRTPWLLAIPFAPHGLGGLAVIACSDTGTLFFAGIFNPTFGSYRMNATEDDFMARVTSSWSISSKSVQPMFIAVGGVLSLAVSLRVTLAIAAVLCVASVPLLPWGNLLSGRPDELSSGPGETDRHRDGAADRDRERGGVGQVHDDPGHRDDEPVEPLAELGQDGVDRGTGGAHHRLRLDLSAEMVDAADRRGQVRESRPR
jgi:predicted MFS family arabinose efflux permease